MEQSNAGQKEKASSSTATPSREKHRSKRETPGRERRRRWWFLPLAMAFGLIGGLLIAEAGLRVYLAYTFSRRLGGPTESVPSDVEVDVSLADLLCGDPDREIVYRFKPGARGRFMQLPVEINSRGFPDAEVSSEKTSRTLRIIGLGDSTMFGWGVRREERYMDLVEARLGEVFAPRYDVEIIVNAVPGWMAIQEIASFHASMLDLNADAVVIQFDPNDIKIPTNMFEPDFLRLDRVYLAALRSGPGGQALDELLEPDYDTPPRKYDSIIGWEPLTQAYRRLKQTCDRKGIELFAITAPRASDASEPDYDPEAAGLHESFAALCSELGIGLIDTNQLGYPYAGGGSLPQGDPSLHLPGDAHPSILGHAMMARALLRGLLPALAEGRLTGERLQAAMELVERKMDELYPPFPSRGLYHPEYWEDIPIQWTQERSSLLFKPRGASLAVNYFVGHPDVSAEKPVVVSLTVGTAQPEQFIHRGKGYVSHRFELGDYDGDFVELRIEVSRLFRESPKGRFLGIGLYPLEFPDEEETPRTQIAPVAEPVATP